MPKTKTTPKRGGKGRSGRGRSPTRIPRVGKGRGRGSALAVPGKADSGRKHGGLGQGSHKVIITTAVTAAEEWPSLEKAVVIVCLI